MSNPGVILSKAVLDKITAAAQTIHHGQIILHINRDKPKTVDVELISRERLDL